MQKGERFAAGRYELSELLGSGGFGEVWAATDTTTDLRVALKILHTGVESDPVNLERFDLETRLGAWLVHPGIPRVLDVGRDDTSARRYFAMELVEGAPLGSLALGYGDVLRVVDRLLDVLAHAHARGIVHRDLKPDNVLICRRPDGVDVKLLDFGVVRLAEGALQGALGDTRASGIADMGKAVGSVFWMSPEQASGESSAVGPASDLYSLGVVLFELLHGDVPFKGTLINVLFQHLTAPLPVLVPRPGIPAPLPPDLEALVGRMLAKRYADRVELAADARPVIAALLAHAPSGPLPRPAQRAAVAETADIDLSATMVDTGGASRSASEALASAATAAADVPTAHLTADGSPPRAADADKGATAQAPSRVAPSRILPSTQLLRLRDIPVVGRTGPMARLDAGARRVAAERLAATMVVAGPPGSGKSRLGRWLAEQAHERGAMRVVRVGLERRGRLLPALQLALHEALRCPRLERRYLEQRIDECLALPHDNRQQLTETLLAGAAHLLGEAGAHGVSQGMLAIPGPATIDALLRFSAVPTPRPVLVWLDGLGDEQPGVVGAWLGVLQRRARADRVPLLSVWTEDAASAAGLPDDTEVVQLGPLPDAEAAELLTRVVPELDPDARQALLARAGGMPRLLRELVFDALDRGALRGGHLVEQRPLADDMSSALLDRVERLLEVAGDVAAARRALIRLAWFGEHFSRRELLRLLPGAVTPETLEAHGIIAAARDGRAGQMGFAHPALPALLRGRTSVEERDAVALECAGARLQLALDASGLAEWDDARFQLGRAWRSVQDLATVEAGWVRVYVSDAWAGVAARQREPGLLRARAAELEQLGASGGAPGATAAVLAALWNGFAALIEERPADAEHSFAQAVARLPHDAQPWVRGLATAREAVLYEYRGELPRARAALRAAEPLLTAGSEQAAHDFLRRRLSLALADLWRTDAEVERSAGRLDVALVASGRARQRYQAEGDRLFEAVTRMQSLRLVRMQQERGSPAPTVLDLLRTELRETARLLESLEDRLGQAELAWETGRLALATGRDAEADRMLEHAGQLFAVAGNRSGLAACFNARGELARRGGNLGDAEMHYTAMCQVASELGAPMHVAVGRLNLGWVAAARGDERGAEHFEAALASFGADGPFDLVTTAQIGLAERRWAGGARSDAVVLLAAVESACRREGRALADSDAVAALQRLAALGDEALRATIEALLRS